jgi:hypothetical protein
MDTGTIITSIITSAVTSVAIFYWKSHYEAKTQKNRLASALAAEIQALMVQYGKIGTPLLQILPDGTKKFYITNIDDDFFTIYNHNADKLGYFDTNLVKDIVCLYTNAKGFVCSIKTWNHLVQEPQKRDEEIERYYGCLTRQKAEVFTAAEQVVNNLQKIIT